MKVRLTTDRAMLLGPAQRDGDLIEVNEDEGRRLIASGQAVLEPETAMVGRGQVAMKPRSRTR